MKNFLAISPEVLYPSEKRIGLSLENIDELKALALKNPDKKIRICMHSNPYEVVHEMIIIHVRDYYVRPHAHLDREESIYIIEGEADLVFYDGKGLIIEKIQMGELKSGRVFYYKIPKNQIHTFKIHSEWLVFKEVTHGPFNADTTYFPKFNIKK